ncbi:MAG: HlyC/CorC family transporter [Rickettsiales bacterium]|jgi:Mg2+/Co2+ transporter CorB|nr:HlyC/CorC family transporter [Rickettsiales bacterium]
MPEISNEILFYGIAILLLLFVSAFFSASETAMTAVSRARLYQLVIDGNKRAQAVSKLRRNKEATIGTVLLGNNAVNIAASTIATTLTIRLFGTEEGGLVIVTIVMTLLVVIFTEVLPKTYAIQNAERVSLALSPALSILVKLLYPITHTIQIIIRAVLKLFGVDITQSNTLISATDVVRGTIELHHREGKMIKQDRDMLGSILDLNDIEVENVMIHRMEVETIDATLPAPELIKQAVSTMHSRIPLWRGEPDNIIGILHVKDLVKAMSGRLGTLSSEDIVAICHKPWFIPETTSLHDQLLAFRNRRQHFALVVDEYGSWQGIVTLEDIIEEIVGNIDDEHDESSREIQKISDHSYLVNGSVTLRDLKRQLDWDFPDEHASTIAGLLIHEAQTIPSVGDHYFFHGFRFTVVEKDDTQLTSLRIEKLASAPIEDDVEL